MNIEGAYIVITGAAKGIGAAMAKGFLEQNAAGILLSDIDAKALKQTAQELDAEGNKVITQVASVDSEKDVEQLIASAYEQWGRVDLFCSNAGIMQQGDLSVEAAAWNKAWNVNVMGHVNCAKSVIPRMIEQGGGYFLLTCSSAGLLTALGAAPYAVTKHASVALAEWLSITYGKSNIVVSALCPSAVLTDMLVAASDGDAASAVKAGGTVLSVEDVSSAVIEAIGAEQFLILTHPEVAGYMQRKSADIGRWLKGMQKLA